MANRNMIHANKLAEFRDFAVSLGYEVQPIPESSIYEMLRLRSPRPSRKAPLCFYQRDGTEHLTVQSDSEAYWLAEQFIIGRRRQRAAQRKGGAK